MKKLAIALCCLASLLPAQSAADYGLEIPTSRPRLWWTPERLAQARSWYSSNPFTPRSNDYLGQAFRYLMTGERAYARSAIDYAMGVTMNTSGTASNDARWYGETVILIYDWCHDQMTATERSTLMARWNGYIDALRQKFWGGLTMPQNNYFWGYLRNEFEWAVATWHENPSAPTFLGHALNSRWRDAFLPHAATWGRGGVLHEGSQYGRYLIDYFTVPAVSAGLMGRNLLGETNYFREALYYLIYATTPGRTALRMDGSMRWEVFPFADDQWFVNGGNAEGGHWANFMGMAADVWRDEPAGQYARRWQRMVGTSPAPFIAAADRGGAEREFSSLPLDYYSPGTRYLFGRTGWGPEATAFHLQLGNVNDGGSHDHRDYGNWQIWRNGRWLSRETTGYAQTLAGYAGSGTVETNHPVAHNVLLVNGNGVFHDWRGAGAKVTRLESRPDYTYAAVDLTPSFNDPAAARVEREFLFIRPLETMVVFDRVTSTTASATKTFLAHFERQPVVDGANTYLAVNGDQALRVATLAPSAPVYRVINEAGTIGQYRLEVETGGEALSHFLHVIQARGATEQNLIWQLTETATEYAVTLQHPSRGHARVVFQKGQSSSGGGFAWSGDGAPTGVSPFIDRVQGIEVTASAGPVWEELATAPPVDSSPPVISGVSASAVGTASANISWTTDEPADGQVEYGTTGAYGMSSALSGALAQAQSVALQNLTAGTTYHYRVRSRDAAGNLAVSPGYTFTTVAAAVEHTIVASAGQGGAISPSGAVRVTTGDNQAFVIAPAAGYQIADVQVDGVSVGAVSSHTCSNVNRDQSIAATFAPAAQAPPPGGIAIPITVHAYAGDGPANLVSNALPFKPGALLDDRNVRVMDGGVEVPAAAVVLARWPQDNSIRSLLLQFSATFSGDSKEYTVWTGSPRAASATAIPVTWDLPARIFTLPAAHLSESLVFGPQVPLGQTGVPEWETRQLSAYSRIETVGSAACSRDDQYYDSISTTLQLYARTGQLRYLVNARKWALHHRRDQIHLDGPNVGRPRCSGNYLNNTRYTFPQGLAGDYFMFGDEENRRVSALVVDNFYMPHADGYYYKAPNARGWWTEREAAFAIIGMLAHYEATGNGLYLARIKERVAMLHRMQVDNGRRAWVHNLYDHDPSEGCGTSDWGSSPWMSGLLLEGIAGYHRLTGDPIARESILMAVDDIRARYVASGSYAGRSFVYLGCPAYRDGTPDLDNLISHAFGYAYKLTGNEAYRQFGAALFNTAVQNGYTGGAKQYNQQFRSSGHFLAYVAVAPPADPVAPTVAVIAPSAGQAVRGTITLVAEATSATGVQFLINGKPHGQEDTTNTYSAPLDTTGLPNGVHTVAAQARDAAGNVLLSTPVSFTVDNSDITPPTVAMIVPMAGQTVSGNMTLAANATDNAGVAGIQFLVDGKPYGAEGSASPYAVPLDTRTLANGVHTAAARARDAAGNFQTSAAVSFTVNNYVAPAPSPLAVAITSPKANESIHGLVTVTAAASGGAGVAGVQFLVNGRPYGAEDTAAPYSIGLHTSALPNGTHTIGARARDAAGNLATSSATVTVVDNSPFWTVRVNAGGAEWLDVYNKTWVADAGFEGGLTRRAQGAVLHGAEAPYQEQRYGSSFLYTFYVPNGTYWLTLDLAEIDPAVTSAGQRLFNVHVNGVRVLSEFDVFATAGGSNRAWSVRLPVSASSGRVRMAFTGVKSDAIVNAIRLAPR